MELAFDSTELRKLCEHAGYASEKLGKDAAERLKHRVADMMAATCPLDILAGNCRPSGTGHQYMEVDLCDGFKIELCANHVTNPTDDDGQVVWRKVNRVKITRIDNDNAATTRY